VLICNSLNSNKPADSKTNFTPEDLSKYNNWVIKQVFSVEPDIATIKSALNSGIGNDADFIYSNEVDVVKQSVNHILVTPKLGSIAYQFGKSAIIVYNVVSNAIDFRVNGNTNPGPGATIELEPKGLSTSVTGAINWSIEEADSTPHLVMLTNATLPSTSNCQIQYANVAASNTSAIVKAYYHNNNDSATFYININLMSQDNFKVQLTYPTTTITAKTGGTTGAGVYKVNDVIQSGVTYSHNIGVLPAGIT
jgi:hypothetical protein